MLEGKKANIRLGGDFDPVPMDRYTIQIADVNFVNQFSKWKGKEEELLNYQYVILDEKQMPVKEGQEKADTTRGRFLWHRMSQTLGQKSWLLKLVKAAYGRDLTKEEMENFDPEAIVGYQVDVMVEQTPNKEGTTIYNNVVSYAKTLKMLEVMPEDSAVATKKNVVENTTTPAEAPEEEDPDKFIDGLEEEKAEKAEASQGERDVTEEEAEEAELEAKLAVAKAKSAKAKAAAMAKKE